MEKVDYPRNKNDEVIAIIHPNLQVNSTVVSIYTIFKCSCVASATLWYIVNKIFIMRLLLTGLPNTADLPHSKLLTEVIQYFGN